MAKTAYLDPDGKLINFSVWSELRKVEPDPWIIKIYENDKFHVQLKALYGAIVPNGAPREHWIRFEMVVQNIMTEDAHGNAFNAPMYVRDPHASRFYRTKEAAIDGYYAFLKEYTNSNFEGGEFIERGNKFSKDIPVVVKNAANETLFGSW